MGHSHSHTVKVLSLKNAMETLALGYPLVDSLNQVILFLIILTSYSCRNLMGGASVRNAAGLEMGGATAAISHLGLQSPPPG